MIHFAHGAAAIASGLRGTGLTAHGKSGSSGVGRTRDVIAPTGLASQCKTSPALKLPQSYRMIHHPFLPNPAVRPGRLL